MHTRTTTMLVTVTMLLTAGCGSEPSQDEIADRCIKAVNALDTPPHVDDPRPEECEGLADDDYQLVILHRGLQDEGIFGDDG
jgi:hypothetical protein